MRVTVIGAGYVGLVTAACLAELGHRVANADIDAAKIARLKRGESPIYEPGLESILQRNLRDRRLSFTDDVGAALEQPEVVFIAVGTPASGHGFADLGYVMSAARTIGQRLQRPAVIAVKSTVPPGTCLRIGQTIRLELAQRGLWLSTPIVSNPEFLREGCAVDDCQQPDRIVVGADDADAVTVMRQLYGGILRRGCPLIEVDLASAELTKYGANALLASRVSLINELALIAEAVGADIEQVRRGLAADHRIGPHFLAAGAGYGGSCFPKDMRALARLASEAGVEPHMIAAAETVNEQQKHRLAQRIVDWFASRGGLTGRTIALWGLAFKPGTDDMREAPSMAVVADLLAAGASLRVHDPVARETARRALPAHARLVFVDSAEAALTGADALALVTEWPAYREVSAPAIAAALAVPIVFDGRNALDRQALLAAGIEVVGVGRSTLLQPAAAEAADTLPAATTVAT